MRYTLVSILAMMVAAVPVYPHGGDRLKGEISIEVVSENGGLFRTIEHQDFWRGETRIS